MTQQPPGPGQPWQPGPAPWESGRQQPMGQPQHPMGQPQHQQPQRPMAPPMPMPMHQSPAPVSKTSIWRIALGTFIGLWLFFVSLVILAAILGESLQNDFDSNFNFSQGTFSSALR